VIRATPGWTRTNGAAKAPKPARALIPAAARPPERDLSRVEEDLSADAIETFTTAVGGRQALTSALTLADLSGQADRVIDILLDSRYASWSLRRICSQVGITVADLFAAYKKAALAKAHIEAFHLIAGKLLPVVEDVMTRATPVDLTCPRCEGRPARPGETPCLTCHGSGKVRSEPDLDRQKLALELGQLTEKRGGGIVLQQNQGVVTPSVVAVTGGGALEQLHQAVGELLFSPTRRRSASPRATDLPVGDPQVDTTPLQEPPAHQPPLPWPHEDEPDEDSDEGEDEDEPDDQDDETPQR
jgi:hypothetical protein